MARRIFIKRSGTKVRAVRVSDISPCFVPAIVEF
jgi:hypothetical protein